MNKQDAVLPNGYYRMSDEDESCGIVYAASGVIGDDTVQWYLEQGYTFEPVVVMTQAEYDALNARVADLERRLAAAGEWLPDHLLERRDDE